MAKYSRGGVIVVAALCLGGILFPLTSSAPKRSSTPSSNAVDMQEGLQQIAVDDERCQETGMRVLNESGNAVDAAVAALLCLGVVNFHSSGIGGGMVMVVANKTDSDDITVAVIDAREVAPQSVAQGELPYTKERAEYGPSSITVPGELRGMKMALEMFSDDSPENRKKLFEDAISYAENGFEASAHLLYAINSAVVNLPERRGEHNFYCHESAPWFQHLKSLFPVDREYEFNRTTNITRPQLATTLKTIERDGFDAFYTGTVATDLVNDISNACRTGPDYCRRLSSIITTEELRSYQPVLRDPFKFSYDSSSGYDVYTAPAPFGGPALGVFLGIVTDKVNRNSEEHNVYHYITEAAKFAASYRMKLGDPDKNSAADVTPANVATEVQNILKKISDKAEPATDLDYYGFDDGRSADGMGTTHLSVITPDMAVSVTSSINDFFGSGFLSSTTGVILNNDMDAFALDGNLVRFPFNHIEAEKRPLSAKCPTVVVDRSSGNVTLVTGAAGGTRIPPAVGQTMFYTLTKKSSVKSATCKPRVYADLRNATSNAIIFQQVELCDASTIPGVGFPSNSKTLMWLTSESEHNQSAYENYTARSVVQTILRDKNGIDAHSDVRKFGGDCNWGFHTNVKLLLIVTSFALQYICIYM